MKVLKKNEQEWKKKKQPEEALRMQNNIFDGV